MVVNASFLHQECDHISYGLFNNSSLNQDRDKLEFMSDLPQHSGYLF